MIKFAQLLTTNLVLAIPASMVLGFIIGYITDVTPLKMLILPLSFLMVYPMMINLKLKKLLEGGDIKLHAVTQALNFLVIPFIALGIARLFFVDQPYLMLGLVLAALLPTSGMTISYTGLARGNMEAAVKMTVIGLIIGSLAAPIYLDRLLGEKINIDIMSVVLNIALVVFLPMVAGYATQHYLIRRHGQKVFNEAYGPKMGPLSTYGVVGMVFVATALKARSITEDPHVVLTVLVPLAIFYAINFAISVITGKLFFSRDDAIALLFGSAIRNLSIALAVAINAFGERGSDAALLISLAYIIQVQSSSWFVKFTDTVYGKKNLPAK